MDLSELAGVGAQINISNGVDTLVMRKALDQQTLQADAIQQLASSTAANRAMERSVMPHLGGNVDISA